MHCLKEKLNVLDLFYLSGFYWKVLRAQSHFHLVLYELKQTENSPVFLYLHKKESGSRRFVTYDIGSQLARPVLNIQISKVCICENPQ